MDIENKLNIKKLLCYNIVNNSKCVYKGKCMFAHNLAEQKKEPLREYINDMIYKMDDLSNIDIYQDKVLLDELVIYTKECKNCLNKKCPGGYNCKFGACIKDIKICYNDLMHGKCYNILTDENTNIKRCIHGIHLTEKNLISYYQRVPLDIYSNDLIVNSENNINYNSKNNLISIVLNEKTIRLVKELTSNRISKSELIKFFNNKKKINNILNKDDDLNDLFDKEEIDELFNNESIDNEEIEVNKIDEVIEVNEVNEINEQIKLDDMEKKDSIEDIKSTIILEYLDDVETDNKIKLEGMYYKNKDIEPNKKKLEYDYSDIINIDLNYELKNLGIKLE